MAQVESAREGSRWIGDRPDGETVAKWFIENCPVHEGMKAEDWADGVVLIENHDTINDEKVSIWTPYVKVDTRVRYWHEWLSKHEDWLGVIEPVPVQKVETTGLFNLHLPPGFFNFPVRKADGEVTTSLGISMRARVFERSTVKQEVRDDGLIVTTGTLIQDAPAGTKTVNLLTRWGADENVVMKVETGAIGRALGMAGVLVIPGSSVAAAEDIADALANEGRPTPAAPAEEHTEAQEPSEEDLHTQLKEKLGELQETYPNRFAHIQTWARGRGIRSMSELNATALKGTLRKVEGEIAAGGQQGDLAPAEEPAEEAKDDV